jgi:uncharacterized protein YndB with AHSA1/START domain
MAEVIERELELPAPPETIWAAITDPVWLREWLADEAELELWPGGEARFTTGGQVRNGWVEEVSPPAPGAGSGARGRLAFWWETPEDGPSRVALEVIGTATGTRLRVSETRPLEVLDLVGVPLGGGSSAIGGQRLGPSLVAA